MASPERRNPVGFSPIKERRFYMANVFISYSRKDIGVARKLTDELEKNNLDFWVDWEGIPPTVDWWKQIERGIEESDIFVFLMSPDSVTSKVCRQEVAHAALNAKRIIPLVVQDVKDDVLEHLGRLNWIFFRPQDDFETSLQTLKTAIHTDYDWVQTHRRLQVKALEWERNYREDSFLLRGRDLQDAEAQLSLNGHKNPFPSELQGEYVRRSADMQKREIFQQRLSEQQMQLEKKLGAQMRRLTYILIAVFTVAFAVLFFWLNEVIGNLAVASVKNQMMAIAETGVSFIDGDAYADMIDSYDQGDADVLEDEYYRWLAYIVDRVVSTNENIEGDVGVYFVTFAEQENHVLAVYTDYDEFKSLWEVESDSVLLTGMEETSANTIVYDDEYGSWVSACTPILDSAEDSVGALCVDLEASYVEETRSQATKTLWIAFVAIYPAMILTVILTSRSLTKQRAQIAGEIPA